MGLPPLAPEASVSAIPPPEQIVNGRRGPYEASRRPSRPA